jgi:TRAP-type mannitol/chloroaromatic compound transport system substrate-binding protein
MSKEQVKPEASRRKFLTGAAAATAGAATLGFPMIAKSQSPIVIKMQGAWGAKDIFNEMAQEYVTRVNEMTGGRLRIDYLVAGAVVKPFEVMDATSKGVLDACHSVPVYWYGKSKVASLFGSGPINGCDAHQTLASRSTTSCSARSTSMLSAFSPCRCRPSRSAGSRTRSRTPSS